MQPGHTEGGRETFPFSRRTESLKGIFLPRVAGPSPTRASAAPLRTCCAPRCPSAPRQAGLSARGTPLTSGRPSAPEGREGAGLRGTPVLAPAPRTRLGKGRPGPATVGRPRCAGAPRTRRAAEGCARGPRGWRRQGARLAEGGPCPQTRQPCARVAPEALVGGGRARLCGHLRLAALLPGRGASGQGPHAEGCPGGSAAGHPVAGRLAPGGLRPSWDPRPSEQRLFSATCLPFVFIVISYYEPPAHRPSLSSLVEITPPRQVPRFPHSKTSPTVKTRRPDRVHGLGRPGGWGPGQPSDAVP